MYIARMPLVAAGLAVFAMLGASIAVGQTSSGSAAQSGQAGQSASSDQSSGQTTTGQTSSVQSEGVQSNAQSGTQAGQTGATKETNLPTSESGTTPQQVNAPVVDPETAAQQSAGAKAASGQSAAGAAAGGQNANNQSGNTQDWPAPQRYEAGRGAGSSAESGQGGATLGVNIISSQDGQGVVVARIRPGTPADQMGLRPRDRVISVNAQQVASVDEFISTIRGMKPGTDIQLSIERDGNTRDIRGKLGALREAIAAGEGPVGNIVGRARDFMGRERSGRIGDSYRSGDNMQTSYEEGSPSGRQGSGDLEARLSRVEQQLSQITRDLAEIRTANRSSSTGSPALPETGAAARATSPRAPSAIRPTPGQPPSGLQTPTR